MVAKYATTTQSTSKHQLKLNACRPAIVFQIVQRGQFDMADHMENGEKKLFRPRELVLKMDLPTHVPFRVSCYNSLMEEMSVEP